MTTDFTRQGFPRIPCHILTKPSRFSQNHFRPYLPYHLQKEMTHVVWNVLSCEYKLLKDPAFARIQIKQECIPVGCVPPAAVAVCLGGGGGVCLSACWDTNAPGCGPGDPPRCEPGDPLGVGLETPPGCGPETPRVWAWRPLLCTEFLTHASENITLPQLCCGR